MTRSTAGRRRGPGPLRVVVVEGHLRENGGLRVSHDLVRLLARRDVQASLFVVQVVADDSAQLQLDPSVDVGYGSDAPRRMRSLLPGALRRLVRASRHADVVIAGSEIGWGLLLGWAAARLARRPFVVLVQGSLPRALAEWVPRGQRHLTRWVHRRADRALCVATGLVEEVVANGLARERVVVVPVGVDVDAILDASRADPDVPLPPGPYLVAAGRMSPLKGFDVLLRALAQGGEQLAGHHLVILGEGPERASLEALAADLGVSGRVWMPGFSARPQPVLARAGAFVLSSRSEGMGGLVLLEAMAQGIPVIATDCVTGPRDLLRDGAIGELVPVDDVGALAAALVAHALDPSPLRARAALGPPRAREFDTDHWLDALLVAIAPLVGPGLLPDRRPEQVGPEERPEQQRPEQRREGAAR